jgi:hypothetical protein
MGEGAGTRGGLQGGEEEEEEEAALSAHREEATASRRPERLHMYRATHACARMDPQMDPCARLWWRVWDRRSE